MEPPPSKKRLKHVWELNMQYQRWCYKKSGKDWLFQNGAGQVALHMGKKTNKIRALPNTTHKIKIQMY